MASYIFQRPESRMWWIKLRSGGKRIERSLGTPDKLQAEIIAADLIRDHKAALMAARPHIESAWQPALEPGREHAGPDGGKIVATDQLLIHIGPNGGIIRQEPNGGMVQSVVPPYPASSARAVVKFINSLSDARPVVTTKSGDDAILEAYLQHRRITGYIEREARQVWALFKTLTNGKPLKDCTRDDGRLLVAHFEAHGLKSATIEKKAAWPNAAVNFAIKEGRLKFNPFASITPRIRDKTQRLPMKDNDMKIIKKNLGRLDDADQLLIRLLASTGLRISEAYEIDGEEKERGVRYVMVGRKTEQSLRRVPLPAAVLSHLPKKITGPLFVQTEHKDPSDAASKRLNKFLDAIGIDDPRKVVHSLRHRAQDRLRAAGCPEDVRWALLGHEEKTVAAGYGEGFPVPLLRRWIDKIGV
jgi:integrase